MAVRCGRLDWSLCVRCRRPGCDLRPGMQTIAAEHHPAGVSRPPGQHNTFHQVLDGQFYKRDATFKCTSAPETTASLWFRFSTWHIVFSLQSDVSWRFVRRVSYHVTDECHQCAVLDFSQPVHIRDTNNTACLSHGVEHRRVPGCLRTWRGLRCQSA